MLRLIKLLIVAFLLFAIAGAGWLYHFAHRPLVLPGTPFSFTLAPGASLKAVSRQLARAGLFVEPWSFAVLARLTKQANQIKAGEYQISEPLTPLRLLDELVQGQAVTVAVQFIEGHTFAQLRAVLDAHPQLKHDSRGLTDREVLQRLEVDESHPEGLFFPDTYLVGRDASDLAVLKLAYKTMQGHLAKAWVGRDPLTLYTSPYEALIMASIVEKETAAETERPLIAAVFQNRLRKNMKLQTDPTVIYGLGARFDGNLRKQDLASDTPYNTYTRSGLPPTPIAMPGLASLTAALNPAQSDALYFVARGDGTHEFNSSLVGHNRAVAKYQKP